MSTRISTPIDLPGIALPSLHGIWSSAYHLIHPANGDLPDNNENDDLQIWPVPFEDPYSLTSQTAQSAPISSDAGFNIANRIAAGLSFWSECCSDLGCFYECQPGLACGEHPSNVSKPLADGGSEQIYTPSFITSRIACSTFGFQGIDYWGKAERALRKGREREIESRLWDGDCVLDENSEQVNGFLSNGTSIVLGNGQAQPCDAALKMLNCALADCCGGVGMIHAPTPVADCWSCNGCLNSSDVDYGDGFGKRNILTTKVKGNIVVAGSGYSGIGPGGVLPGENQAWVYASSMVYLYWDKIMFSPDNADFGNATTFANNMTEVVAEQLVGAFYDPCCNFAVLVDLCA